MQIERLKTKLHKKIHTCFLVDVRSLSVSNVVLPFTLVNITIDVEIFALPTPLVFHPTSCRNKNSHVWSHQDINNDLCMFTFIFWAVWVNKCSLTMFFVCHPFTNVSSTVFKSKKLSTSIKAYLKIHVQGYSWLPVGTESMSFSVFISTFIRVAVR